MGTPAPDSEVMDKVVNLCKRRGIIFQSADIYGGFRSTYDYGPIGSLMLRNVKDAWWKSMVQLRHDIVGLDASILSPPAVWEASGHLENFTDPLVDCKECNERFREDQLEDPSTCPACGATNSFTEARAFNLMFKTYAGPVEGSGHAVYLRPETAQGMFTNFKLVLETSRKKPPFGIAQVGKTFEMRSPQVISFPHTRIRTNGNGILRTTRRRRQMVQILVQRTHELVHRFGNTRRPTTITPPTKMNSATTVQGPATSNISSRGDGENSKGSRIEATTTFANTANTPEKNSPTSTQNSVSITSPTSSNPQRGLHVQ